MSRRSLLPRPRLDAEALRSGPVRERGVDSVLAMRGQRAANQDRRCMRMPQGHVRVPCVLLLCSACRLRSMVLHWLWNGAACATCTVKEACDGAMRPSSVAASAYVTGFFSRQKHGINPTTCEECPEGVMCDKAGQVWSDLPLYMGYWQEPSWVRVLWRSCLAAPQSRFLRSSSAHLRSRFALGTCRAVLHAQADLWGCTHDA